MEEVPHKAARAHHGDLALDARHVEGVDDGGNPSHDGEEEHERREGPYPVGIVSSQDAVEEHPGERGAYDAGKRHHQRARHDEGDGRAQALQTLAHEGDGVGGLASPLEALADLELQRYAGKRSLELLHGHLDLATCGVVDVGAVAPEASEHHKVVEVPKDDARVRALGHYGLGAIRPALGPQTITARRLEDVGCLGAVARHAAIGARLLQRNPAAIVGEDHGKAGGSALERLHLHDLRDVLNTSLCHVRLLPSQDEHDGRNALGGYVDCLRHALRKR